MREKNVFEQNTGISSTSDSKNVRFNLPFANNIYIHTPTHLNDVELSVECRDKGMRKGLLMMGSCCIMNVEGKTTENVSKRVENVEGGSSVFASRQREQ